MDVVWLKRDLRLHDHGPFEEIIQSKKNNDNNDTPFCIIYLFEPDQLSEPTVHGSHISFINESLVDLDLLLSGKSTTTTTTTTSIRTISTATTVTSYTFQVLTVCYANAVYTFDILNRQTKINRILCHEETGHYKSFIRDKSVRKWCKSNNVPIIEYNQTGVTRCLKDRNDFAKKLNEFLMKPLYNSIDKTFMIDDDDDKNNNRKYKIIQACQTRLVTTLNLHGRIQHPINVQTINEIPIEHRVDRMQRQSGGETKALEVLNSFLSSRGSFYSGGISSPNTSWNSCSRLSPYLAWGNISLRFVIHKTRERQRYLREQKNERKKQSSNIMYNFNYTENENYISPTSTSASKQDEYWLKSLQAFSSRIHWRSHFIQKLESEPLMEKQDLCPAYQHLRRQPNDFNQSYYDAWSTGYTGFPFLDACMRCLHKHGWLNFRMRAMIVSFATYNLWLDWKRIAPHLARLFLDYEPGIHYPQLQMQSGTTGINAMRVYNITKQGKDQDPSGIFIKKYVEELTDVPLEYIHEPSTMPKKLQNKIKVYIVKSPLLHMSCHKSNNNVNTSVAKSGNQQQCNYYPEPIVNEQQSAKEAKDKVAAVRKQESTKKLAEQVYIKHGSRNNRMEKRNRDGMFSTISKSHDNASKKKDNQKNNNNVGNDDIVAAKVKAKATISNGQKTIIDLFANCKSDTNKDLEKKTKKLKTGHESKYEQEFQNKKNHTIQHIHYESNNHLNDDVSYTQEKSNNKSFSKGTARTFVSISSSKEKQKGVINSGWSCKACTYINEKPFGLSCSVCGTLR